MKTEKHSKLRILTVVLFVFTSLYVLYIWFHSFMRAETSAAESLFVLDNLMSFFKAIGISIELTDHIVRKAAHFCEYALLGCLVSWCAYLLNKSIVKNLMPTGFVCILTALIDENIQLYSLGRSGQVSDVLLDFVGSVCGATFFIVIIIIVLLIKKRKMKK